MQNDKSKIKNLDTVLSIERTLWLRAWGLVLLSLV